MESVPTLHLAIVIATAGGMLVSLRELIAVFPSIGVTSLLSRWRCWAYLAIGGGFSAGVLSLLHYLSSPDDRFAAVEQIAFAALGTSAAIRPATKASASPSRVSQGQEGNRSGESSLSAVSRVGALIDTLLESLGDELSKQISSRSALLVARGQFVDFDKARPMFFEHIGHTVAGDRLEPANLREAHAKRLTKRWTAADTYALKGASDQARDALLYIALDMGGERLLNALLDLYELRFPPPEVASSRGWRERWRKYRLRRRYARSLAYLDLEVPE